MVSNIKKIIRHLHTGWWLNPVNLVDFVLLRRFPKGGLQSGEIHIRPGFQGYLISAGSLKFGCFPKGRYNLKNIIRRLSTGGVSIPAIFCWVFFVISPFS